MISIYSTLIYVDLHHSSNLHFFTIHLLYQISNATSSSSTRSRPTSTTRKYRILSPTPSSNSSYTPTDAGRSSSPMASPRLLSSRKRLSDEQDWTAIRPTKKYRSDDTSTSSDTRSLITESLSPPPRLHTSRKITDSHSGSSVMSDIKAGTELPKKFANKRVGAGPPSPPATPLSPRRSLSLVPSRLSAVTSTNKSFTGLVSKHTGGIASTSSLDDLDQISLDIPP